MLLWLEETIYIATKIILIFFAISFVAGIFNRKSYNTLYMISDAVSLVVGLVLTLLPLTLMIALIYYS